MIIRLGALLTSLITLSVASRAALATDEINCKSASWAVTLAVGTDGSVASLLIDDTTKTRFREPFSITDLAKDARHVDVSGKAIKVRAKAPSGQILSISSRDGKGRIRFLKTSEKLVCDWNV